MDTTEQLTLSLSVKVGILGCFQAVCNGTRPDLFFPFLCLFVLVVDPEYGFPIFRAFDDFPFSKEWPRGF